MYLADAMPLTPSVEARMIAVCSAGFCFQGVFFAVITFHVTHNLSESGSEQCKYHCVGA